ncbi:MAG: hypothetical protein ACOYOV_02960 [Bacteroidales bacterium]
MIGLIYKNKESLVQLKDFSDYKIIDLDKIDYESLDDWMHNLVIDIEDLQNNIFIPLSFGSILSDFLGLRLALHIRTSATNNQCSNLFLYGTESMESIIQNDFSLILRTKGVFLIDYNLIELKHFAAIKDIILNKIDLKGELGKIHLKVPANLYDNHSVANIWGMYRLLELEEIDPMTINSIVTQKNKLNSIYFKWLLAKNKTEELVTEEVKEIKRNYSVQLPGINIKGKIDLSKIKQ